ncbi:hypothetical protein [Rufibacter sp. XAAS-G3-1]|uniref:hypothetical protein n=1 Tax=Rufibacter sp. XAAS-G3-1 TaxID=2729134 RepID=UPI0015E63936|nr:hypothetical protein [Rufibacter sp. XAAS-G3-1]
MPTTPQKALDFSKLVFKEAAFLDFCIKNNTTSHAAPISINAFNCTFSTSNSFSLEEKGIKVQLHIQCYAVNEKEEPIGIEGEFNLGFTFIIQNIEEYLIKSKTSDEMIPGPHLVIPLLGTAYSTARGMLLTKTLGTPLEGFALPIVNANDLIKDKPKKKSPTTE